MDQRVEESIEDIRALLVWCVKNVNNKWNFHEYDHAARALGKLGALFLAIEAERDALRMTEEAAMRAALRVMSNLEDRRGVLDGIDEGVKQEIADEIAFTIFASIAAKEPK